jgi:peptide/nickel transport system ATP-binding protein
MTTPLLSVKDLVVEFPTRHGPLTAINGVSFDLAAGEILGLVGESGAGKSITGSAIIGLLDPPGKIASGEIWLQGQRIDNLRGEDIRALRGSRVGMVFQDPLTSLNPLYTIADQLIETIRTHLKISAGEARKRAVGLLNDVGIPAASRRIDDYPHQFSGGMRQRVVIALALAAEPALVIADEPTTALDVSVQAQIIDVLKEQCTQRGASIILITHDMGVIAETADRVAVMYAGRVAEIGPVRDIIKQAKHPYTTGLMGSIPSLTHEGDRLVQIPGAMPRLSAMPTGCAFNPRCDRVFDKCRAERPDLIPVGTHEVSCWLYDDSLDTGAAK